MASLAGLWALGSASQGGHGIPWIRWSGLKSPFKNISSLQLLCITLYTQWLLWNKIIYLVICSICFLTSFESCNLEEKRWCCFVCIFRTDSAKQQRDFHKATWNIAKIGLGTSWILFLPLHLIKYLFDFTLSSLKSHSTIYYFEGKKRALSVQIYWEPK